MKATSVERNYGLTQKGIGLLHLWAESIELRKQVLEKFLKQYKQRFENIREKQ